MAGDDLNTVDMPTPPPPGPEGQAGLESLGAEAAHDDPKQDAAAAPDDGDGPELAAPAEEMGAAIPSAAWDETEGDDDESDPAESVGSPQAVPVRMFDFDYKIMSDKPRLVEILAATIDREARQIRAANDSFNRGSFNWPVQVAFKLALDHYYTQRALGECRRELDQCRKALADLESRVENEAEKMAELIDSRLAGS